MGAGVSPPAEAGGMGSSAEADWGEARISDVATKRRSDGGRRRRKGFRRELVRDGNLAPAWHRARTSDVATKRRRARRRKGFRRELVRDGNLAPAWEGYRDPGVAVSRWHRARTSDVATKRRSDEATKRRGDVATEGKTPEGIPAGVGARWESRTSLSRTHLVPAACEYEIGISPRGRTSLRRGGGALRRESRGRVGSRLNWRSVATYTLPWAPAVVASGRFRPGRRGLGNATRWSGASLGYL